MAGKILQFIDKLKKSCASSVGIIHYSLSVFILFLYLITSQIPSLVLISTQEHIFHECHQCSLLSNTDVKKPLRFSWYFFSHWKFLCCSLWSGSNAVGVGDCLSTNFNGIWILPLIVPLNSFYSQPSSMSQIYFIFKLIMSCYLTFMDFIYFWILSLFHQLLLVKLKPCCSPLPIH